MTILNIHVIKYENRRLARMINDLGELISRENSKIYQDIIVTKFSFNNDLNSNEEKKFLLELYTYMVDKLKEIQY